MVVFQSRVLTTLIPAVAHEVLYDVDDFNSRIVVNVNRFELLYYQLYVACVQILIINMFAGVKLFYNIFQKILKTQVMFLFLQLDQMHLFLLFFAHGLLRGNSLL
jgi:hypothetical protein